MPVNAIKPPRVSAGLVIGLLEAVDEAGGAEDVAQIARDGRLHADLIPELLAAAESLRLVQVDEGDISLTDVGRQLLAARPGERKRIVATSLQDTTAMAELTALLKSRGGSASADAVLEHLAATHGTVRAEELFRSLVYWGRYAQLLRYDSDSLTVSIAPRA